MGIIAVSDVHLGYLKDKESISDTRNFIEFLKKTADRTDITDFVICGDLLDMWRRDIAGVTLENLHILKMIQELQPKNDPTLQPRIKVHYLAGNHDYHICHLNKHYYPFDLTGRDPKEYLRLTEGNKAYYFKHGYDFEPLMKLMECNFDLLCSHSDESGEFMSRLWDELNYEVKNILAYLLNLSPAQRSLLPRNGFNEPDIESLKEYELNNYGPTYTPVLVYGHTHKPFHHQNVINLGSWLKDIEEKHNTCLEIVNDKERLIVFDKDKCDKNNWDRCEAI